MEPVNWQTLLEMLEAEAASLRGDRMQTHELKQRVEKTLSQAEVGSADTTTINRLDLLLLKLTEGVKENVCTNSKCPHYNKKCRMR